MANRGRDRRHTGGLLPIGVHEGQPPAPARGPVTKAQPPRWLRPTGFLGALALLLLAIPLLSLAANRGIELPAAVQRPAERLLRVKPSADCDLETAAMIGARQPDIDQLIVLVTEDFEATEGAAFAAVRLGDDRWACQTDVEFARFGRAGTRSLVQRRSGDGTTPAGLFPLGTQQAWDGQEFQVFGNAADPGMRTGLTYREVDPADCWGATPGASTYQKLFAETNCPGPDDEWLQGFGSVYSHAVVIGANMDPVSGDEPGEPAYAAAIFLHRHSYAANGVDTKPTSGCVSVNQAALGEFVRVLDPALDPHIAIGPVAWLRDP